MLKLLRKTAFLWIGLGCLALSVLSGQAQSIYATLTGIVSDSTGAVVPNANVTLKNESSGDIRKTVTNSDGYYTFVAVPVGSYSLSVETTGFEKYEQTGVAFTGAEKRNVNVTLKVGSTATQVDVISAADIVAPVDSGEKSAVLTTKQLQDFSVVGRSAAEFIKILPGFAIASTGTENRASFTGEVIGINGNGDGGSQSALNNAFAPNGTPTNTMDITADGAHVSDPGCNCATPVNPNTDMIQEVKVLTSNFGAENSKGPIVFNSVSKSGGRDFHGEGYFYARHFSMNANDWLFNKLKQPQPDNKFFFPGGNIGGPVLIPGTNFNKNRDKLFFFTGYEYYYQTLDTAGKSGPLLATVPTPGMLGGNFSPDELSKLGKITASGGPPVVPTGTGIVNGIIPASQFDGTGLGMLKLYPAANADPNATGGYNYVKDIVFNQNSFQWLTRVDYSISDNTKLFVRYNLQKETQLFPVTLWWRNGSSVPYPTPIEGKNQSQSVSASLTHVFSPSLTNEFIFAYTYIDFPNVFQDPKKIDRTALGIPFTGLYKNGIKQIPSVEGWGGDLATIFNPGGFEAGGSKGLFADKYLPTVSDNLAKVWGTHTMKFGFYYEFIINDQPANGNTNGQIIEAPWAGTGNDYADLLTGKVANYSENNFNPLHNEGYNTYELYAQDSWKVTRRITLDYGLRASHFGQWYDRRGTGFAVWNPSTYNPDPSLPATDYTGFDWHLKNTKIPLSGFPTRRMFWAPRFGIAWDVFGTGNTVLRGGWGRYIYHVPQFTTGLDAPAGVLSQALGPTTFADVQGTTPGLGAIGTGGLQLGDDRSPRTDSYSFTISQRLPGASLLEVSYVGNQSSNLLQNGGVGATVNQLRPGTLLNYPVDPSTISTAQYDALRPFPKYEDLTVANHIGYSNYNSLQVSWVRQRGSYDVQFNYTYGKALGLVGTDPFNLANDYGPQGFDRRHIFNAAYSIDLPSPVKTNALLKGVVNGWQISGITQLQSGINLAANTGGNFNINVNNATLANGYKITSQSITGTSSLPVQPILTCDPRKNLAAHQFVNAACFSLPTTPGVNGPTVLPEMFGPWFFNSDLSVFKNFQISESKKLQFRFSAYNFLNHPLYSFIGSESNMNLIFDPATLKNENPNFGITTDKQGHRIVQLAIKFYF